MQQYALKIVFFKLFFIKYVTVNLIDYEAERGGVT